MKYLLFLIMLFCGAIDLRAGSTGNCYEPAVGEIFTLQQQTPFYFLSPVPPAKKLLERIDLSFFRNRMTVSLYRYRLQIPAGLETSVDRRLTVWSPWISDDLTEIKIPRLDLEGGYKLIIEYKPVESNETKVHETPFYVYFPNPAVLASAATSSAPAQVAGDRQGNQTRTVENARPGSPRASSAPTRAAPGTESRDVTSSSGLQKAEEKAEIQRRNDLAELNLEVNIIPEVVKVDNPADTPSASIALIPGEPEAVTDTGSSTSDSDNDGNTQLHIAIAAGDNEYARWLIEKGTETNVLNNLGLSPLHVAALLDNRTIAADLLRAGAVIDMKGPSGYTALHIASEMDHTGIAADLVFNGAKQGIKTEQGLTAASISRIQGNGELSKLISRRDSGLIELVVKTERPESAVNLNERLFADFDLPYDNSMVRRMKFNKTVRIISVPLTAAATASFIYFRTEAQQNLSLSRIAETEEMAKKLYDKSLSCDRNSYISGGVSLVSVYGFIQSTIRKKSITQKMRKTFD